MRKMLYCLLLVIIVFAAVSYDAANASAAPSTVKIHKIDPDPAVPLKVGSSVLFRAEVMYDVQDDSSTVKLLIQRGERSGNHQDVIDSVVKHLKRGKGIVVLEKRIKVPDTKSILVFTPLYPHGHAKTTTTDMRSYKVVK